MKYPLVKKILIFSIVSSISLLSPIQVKAVDDVETLEFDQAFYESSDIPPFYNPSAVCGGGNTIVDTTVDVSGDTNAEVILNFFVSKGLTLAAAAGFAGNMKQESGLDPAIIQGGAIAKDGYKPVNGVGFGLVQWTFGGTTGPRQSGLYQLAQNSNTPIIDIGIQLEYTWKELNASYKTSTLDRLEGISDPVEAAVIVHDNYEVSADTDSEVRSVRGGNAQAYFNKFKNTITDGSGSTINISSETSADGTDSCSTVDTSNGGIGSADGFVFPLKTTKAALKKGTDGMVWCTTNASNCHHHYNAADIFDETGVPIIAAIGGKVIKGGEDASCATYGCNVTIKGDDGRVYFYTHMSKAATVNKGATVSAGDVIGAVGTNSTAVGTPRHLHFDILPSSYNSRPDCASASCMALPFINVQPPLIEAYKTLPEGAVNV
jgi:hypothetical protein